MVSKVIDGTFPDYLRRHVTGPLGLHDLTHCSEEAPPPNRATPYDVRNGQLVPADAWGDVEYGAASRESATDISERFGVHVLADRSVESLSGGERHLVAMARALVPSFHSSLRKSAAATTPHWD